MQIIVFGMHRSGTSPLTRLLNLMGAYVGMEGGLMPPTAFNMKGHWERLDVYKLHQEFFTSVGVSWQKVCRLDLDTINEEQRTTFREQAKIIVHKLDAFRPWTLKDPCMCLLFPLWRDLLEVPICVFIHRSPLQVAQSLQKREGFSIRFGVALWEYYNLAALRHTRKFPRLLVSHGDLMTHPAETVQTLYDDLEELGVRGLRLPSEKEILAFIDPTLHRERGEPELEEQFANPAQLALVHAFADRRVFEWQPIPSLSAGALAELREFETMEATITAYGSAQAASQKKSNENLKTEKNLQPSLAYENDQADESPAIVTAVNGRVGSERAEVCRAQEKAQAERGENDRPPTVICEQQLPFSS